MALITGALSCSGKGSIEILDGIDQATLFATGVELFQSEKWRDAREYLTRFVRLYPESPKAAEAQLMIADSHFNQGGESNFIIAEAEYRKFNSLFPTHQRIDYSALQIGHTYVSRMKSHDRDLTMALNAKEELAKFLKTYPASRYRDEAEKLAEDVNLLLGKHELSVAEMYYKLKIYTSTISRCQYLRSEYPHETWNEKADYLWCSSLLKSGLVEKGRAKLDEFSQRYPNSEYLDKLKEQEAEVEEVAQKIEEKMRKIREKRQPDLKTQKDDDG